MSQLFFLDGEPWLLVDDEKQLRESDLYQQIRQALNRRLNPLVGGVNWQQVYDQCIELGKSEGVDLLVANYYTVAATKLHGISGLANGLELQLAVSAKFAQSSIFSIERRRELLQWLISRIEPELKRLTPSMESLRDLYRCERACQQLDELFKTYQQALSSELESLGFMLFEKIDQAESGFKQAPEPIIQPISRWLRLRWLVLGILLGGLMMVPWAHFGISHEPDPLLSSVTQTSTQPQVLTLSQGRRLRAKFSDQQLQQQQDYLQALYQQRTGQLLEQPFFTPLQQATGLATTLSRIYPNDASIQQFMQRVEQRSNQWKQQYQQQFNHFSGVRSQFANLEQALHYRQLGRAQRIASTLSSYVQSLSPVYGRLQHIDGLLQQHHYADARAQLNTLNERINAIAWQAMIYQQQLPASTASKKLPAEQDLARAGQ